MYGRKEILKFKMVEVVLKIVMWFFFLFIICVWVFIILIGREGGLNN